MIPKPTALLALLLTPLASAHFKLLHPKARGFNDDLLVEYPCGGQNSVSPHRTAFPIDGAPVQLYLEHTQTNFTVVLALGNNPSGADFTHLVLPTIVEFGPRDFCLGDIDIAAALGSAAKPGMNATLLVESNGDSGGNTGLYNCADITLVAGSGGYKNICHNSTGVRVQHVAGLAHVSANGSAIGGGSTGGSASSSGGGGGGGSAAGALAPASFAALGAAAVAVAALAAGVL